MVSEVVFALNRRLDELIPEVGLLDMYYAGTQPLSFLSETSRKALGDRLRTLAVNFPRLTVDALAERLRVVGFKVDGADATALWAAFERSGFEDKNSVVHTEALAVKRSYVIIWADSQGRATISVESCRDVAVQRDPVTGEVHPEWRPRPRERRDGFATF